MRKAPIKMPSAGGIQTAAMDVLYGGVAGFAMAQAARFLGSWGYLAAPIIVGSMVSKDIGKIMAVNAGLALGVGFTGFGGLLGGNKSGSSMEVL